MKKIIIYNKDQYCPIHNIQMLAMYGCGWDYAGAPKGYTLIGINIANGIIDNNEGYMETEIPLKEANKRIKDIAKALKIKEPLKIISGTRMH